MEGDFIIPIKMHNGKFMQMQVKQKNINGKRRKVKTWTAQEDTILLQLYEENPKKWGTIAGLMQDRNQNQCLHRYRRLSQLGVNRKIWSSEEDQAIRKLIKKVGKNWKLLSQTLGTKTGKQIRQRFINKLDPKIKKEEWTDEQDRKLIQLYSQLGSKWSQISKRLPGRPQNKIKNRFYSFIQKNYDIKYKSIENHQKNKASSHQASGNIYPRSILTEKINYHTEDNTILQGYSEYCKQQVPSINEIQLDIKCQHVDFNKENESVNNSKVYLRSLLKIEQEWGIQNRYRSIHEIASQNQFGNDLLYLSHH